MKAFLDKFQHFITVQKEYFHDHLASDFEHEWNDDVWRVGTHGTGWLQGSGKGTLPFDAINKSSKGFDKKVIVEDEDYKSFMKAMLVAVYSKKSSISTSVATASLLILKRWYYELMITTGQTHPIYLTTTVLQTAMSRYRDASNLDDPNVADAYGRCASLQGIVNYYAFCFSPLSFENKVNYSNKTNYTKKALETKALKNKDALDDSETSNDKLISISTFLNVVALINKCETTGEKILLNLVLILIVTGFRSIEAITLHKDALIRREVEDLVTKEKLKNKDLPQYYLGIKYIGAKGAGERIHWVEPLATRLVEAIFSAVQELTAPLREHLCYLRSKKFDNYLPIEIDMLTSDLVELDEVERFIVGTQSEHRGRAGRRDKAFKALSTAGITPVTVTQDGQGKKKFYARSDLSDYIALNFRGNKNQFKEPCVFVWDVAGKQHKVNYEDLLFIHAYRSTNLARPLVNKANPVPFDNLNINDFLGAGRSMSVFQKYDLTENDGSYSKLTSHMPRHNINTFLAIAEISDHVQAMLMGRMDISQNQHYQHLALELRRKEASLISYDKDDCKFGGEVTLHENIEKATTPLEKVKQTGRLTFSDKLDIEKNLKANLHTFDSKDDVADYIEANLYDDLFSDLHDAFDELKSSEGDVAAKELLYRHADLHPLTLGSCIRNITLWGCPYRMKCQSGEACESFVLTGRTDEMDKILLLRETLKINLVELEKLSSTIPSYNEAVIRFRNGLTNMDKLLEKAKSALDKKVVINVYESGIGMSGKDKKNIGKLETLAALFSHERKKLEE